MSSITMVSMDETTIVTSTSAPSVFIRPNGTKDGKELKVTKKLVRATTPNPYGEGCVVRYWLVLRTLLTSIPYHPSYHLACQRQKAHLLMLRL